MTIGEAEIRQSIASASSIDIADAAVDEYQELSRRFLAGDFRPGQLSGGRFAEALFRVCQSICLLPVTRIGDTLPRVDQLIRDLEQSPKTADDAFRIHIPRALRLVYDFRNKRDVAHLSGSVSPNYSDSSLVISVCSWVMSEVVRLFHACSADEAQRIVDGLVDRRRSVIWDNGDVIRVLLPDLGYREKTLLVLYHKHPEAMSERFLFDSVEYSNFSAFRTNVLRRLHSDAFVHLGDDQVILLPPGAAYVETELLPTVGNQTD